MGIIVFMLICTVPLIVWGFVLMWREKQWEKYNKENPSQPDA